MFEPEFEDTLASPFSDALPLAHLRALRAGRALCDSCIRSAAGYTFPYLHDATQEVAQAYGARCTPEFFVFDRDMRLQYHGQFDDSRPSNGVPITGEPALGTRFLGFIATHPVSILVCSISVRGH